MYAEEVKSMLQQQKSSQAYILLKERVLFIYVHNLRKKQEFSTTVLNISLNNFNTALICAMVLKSQKRGDILSSTAQ